jgi:restriction system protein
MFKIPATLTPKQFEEEVEKLVRKMGIDLKDFSVQRLEKIQGDDGIYEIDVTARFEAIGANFLVLIECKHHKHPIKREVVQVLFDRLRSVAGHKGMIFSTSAFQSGAIEFARAHGILLVQIADGRTAYLTRSFDQSPPLPEGAPRYVGWIIGINENGNEYSTLIQGGNSDSLLKGFLL